MKVILAILGVLLGIWILGMVVRGLFWVGMVALGLFVVVAIVGFVRGQLGGSSRSSINS